MFRSRAEETHSSVLRHSFEERLIFILFFLDSVMVALKFKVSLFCLDYDNAQPKFIKDLYNLKEKLYKLKNILLQMSLDLKLTLLSF